MKEKMFVVPGSFVPFNDTVTLLSYKRLRNLDLDMDVFAFKGKEDPGLVKELEKDENFKKFNITYTSDLDWAIPRYYPIRLPVGLYLMWKYVNDAVKEFEKKDYRYLFTSIVPGISHIAGYHIKKKHPEVEWYASFSDPFKGSPYKKADLSDTNIIYKLMYNVGAFCLYNNRFEEVAVENADKLVFICEEQRDFTLGQYKDTDKLLKKSIIMPLTYIPQWEMYKSILNAGKAKHTVKQAVHLGRLYGLRKPTSFIKALSELKNEDKDLNNKIVFHQYSEIQPSDVKMIKDHGLEDLFIIHDKVSYDESINIMKEADILVLFDTLMPGEPVQPYLPSKIVEYLLLMKPILGICDSNSPSYRILKEYGYNTVGCSTEEIKKSIRAVIEDESVPEYSLEKLDCNYYRMIK